MGLKNYAKIEDAPLSDLLRQAIIKAENQLMMFSDSIWKACTYNVRSTEEYILFYQGEPIDHSSHVSGTLTQSSAEIYYNASCTAGMDLTQLSKLNN